MAPRPRPLPLARHLILSCALTLPFVGALAAQEPKTYASTGCMPWGAPSLIVEVAGLPHGSTARLRIWGGGIDSVKSGRKLDLGTRPEGETPPSSGPGDSSVCDASGLCDGEPSIFFLSRVAPSAEQKITGTLQFKKSITPKPLDIKAVIADGGPCVP